MGSGLFYISPEESNTTLLGQNTQLLRSAPVQILRSSRSEPRCPVKSWRHCSASYSGLDRLETKCPARRSLATIAARVRTLSFWKIRVIYVPTVPWLMPRSDAISLFDNPRATRRAICRSRGLILISSREVSLTFSPCVVDSSVPGMKLDWDMHPTLTTSYTKF